MSKEKLIDFIEGQGDRKTVCPFANTKQVLYADATNWSGIDGGIKILLEFLKAPKHVLLVECKLFRTENETLEEGRRIFDLLGIAGMYITARSIYKTHRETLNKAITHYRINKLAIELLGGDDSGWFNTLQVNNMTINTIFAHPQTCEKGRFRWAPNPVLVLLWRPYVGEIIETRENTVLRLREKIQRELGGYYFGDTIFVTSDTKLYQKPVNEDMQEERAKYEEALNKAEKIVNKRG
jgi:hypothetical protein